MQLIVCKHLSLIYLVRGAANLCCQFQLLTHHWPAQSRWRLLQAGGSATGKVCSNQSVKFLTQDSPWEAAQTWASWSVGAGWAKMPVSMSYVLRPAVHKLSLCGIWCRYNSSMVLYCSVQTLKLFSYKQSKTNILTYNCHN